MCALNRKTYIMLYKNQSTYNTYRITIHEKTFLNVTNGKRSSEKSQIMSGLNSLIST